MHKFILLVSSLLLSACVSNVKVAEDQKIPTLQKDKAQIVFIRSTSINALVNTAIYDVTSGSPKLVGNIPNGSKVLAEMVPGNYIFMVGNNGHQDFMRATVLPNKRYHVVVTAYWPANFSMRPFRHKNSEFIYSTNKFSELMNSTQIVLETPESTKNFEGDREKITSFYKQQWEKWQTKTNEEKEIQTLNPNDNMD